MPPQSSLDEFRHLVGEDPAFQRRIWTMQRIGWALMGGLVLAGAAGALGDGPFSRGESASPDGALRVSHDAVTRQDSATRWTITLPPGARQVTLTSDALPWLEVLNIEPAPDGQARRGQALTLHLQDSSVAVLTVQPQRPGIADVSVAAGGAAASFRTLVLP
ncbi:hypothetical protein GXW78_07760 [Roseomonas terrae]|uniref:Anti-sigma factor n=1 Tax=Neoroseomonas terrae TaxID=424799 RepID=A0ABS5EEV7_9PROT|nr:hypothetical protein [Neoroseomonas terrae]MBR0649551.1 hypothetical protein [Neoroseomonas terrae]